MTTSGTYQRNGKRAARWLAREIGIVGLSYSLLVQLMRSTRTSASLMIVAVVVGLFAASATARAHHGTANVYDSKAIVLMGTITKFEWTNPHNQIYFDVKDEKGNVVHWIAATEPPQVMIERGWTRRSLKEGDQVTMYVFAAKNGAPVGNVQRIVFADGKELTTFGPRPAETAPPAK